MTTKTYENGMIETIDAHGHVVKQQYPNGNTWTYIQVNGETKTEYLPDGSRYVYKMNGDVKEIRRPDGTVAEKF